MSIRTVTGGPGAALRVMVVKPADLGLAKKLLGLLRRTMACLRLPPHWRGLVKLGPIAQMDEATVHCVETREDNKKRGRGV